MGRLHLLCPGRAGRLDRTFLPLKWGRTRRAWKDAPLAPRPLCADTGPGPQPVLLPTGAVTTSSTPDGPALGLSAKLFRSQMVTCQFLWVSGDGEAVMPLSDPCDWGSTGPNPSARCLGPRPRSPPPLGLQAGWACTHQPPALRGLPNSSLPGRLVSQTRPWPWKVQASGVA